MTPHDDELVPGPLPVRFVGADLDDRLVELLMPYIGHAIEGQSDPAGCADAAFLHGIHVAVTGDPLQVTCSLFDEAGELHALCMVPGRLAGVVPAGGGWLFVGRDEAR